MKMASQAKFQGLKLVKEIQDIQAAVANSRKRKRTSVVSLKEERGINKKEERDGRRDNVWNATQSEGPQEVVPAPRKRAKDALKEYRR
jgi:hypothetical protein